MTRLMSRRVHRREMQAVSEALRLLVNIGMAWIYNCARHRHTIFATIR
jgi:hypothetical protein